LIPILGWGSIFYDAHASLVRIICTSDFFSKPYLAILYIIVDCFVSCTQ
jgi:hypothetical protein